MVGASICEAFGEYTHAKKQIVMKKYQLFNGNNIDKLRELEDNSVDAVVTDPPYGLSFMGKKWDYDVPSIELWQEVYRVLKPGGHVLSFGGTRTYHRMVVNMEDAGFEIRDQIQWLYGSGFPKSHNIGKAIDKMQGNEREVVGKKENWLDTNNRKPGDTSMYDNAWGDNKRVDLDITKGQTEWEGWGTALKPANEPICLARKPLVGTVAENVLQHGTGGLNIDGCRVGTDEPIAAHYNTGASIGYITGKSNIVYQKGDAGDHNTHTLGRFPANVIHDGSDEVVELFPQSNGRMGVVNYGAVKFFPTNYDKDKNQRDTGGTKDFGSAARFFYCAKVSKSERNAGCGGMEERDVFRGNHVDNPVCQTCGGSKFNRGNGVCACETPVWKVNDTPRRNHHPTVKPIDLMRYLCKLITPPGGIVLDPFMGSGSTGCAAILEDFKFIGMELDEEYFKIAEARITHFNPSDFW